jgi:GTP-binding protein
MDCSDAALEAGRSLFAGECRFMLSVVRTADLPESDAPEVAFAGRSNVGKSSLLNALTNRKALARTSNTPGRTQALNFFDMGGALHLVDMPGYGYAKAPKQLVENWHGLIDDYLRGRVNLRQCFVLVDARHGTKPIDKAVMDRLDSAAVAYRVILTKIDKVSKSGLEAARADVAAAIKQRAAAAPEIVETSSQTGEGIDILRAHLAVISGATDGTL